jgi:transposase
MSPRLAKNAVRSARSTVADCTPARHRGEGRPLAFVVTGGNTNDCTVHHRDGSDPGTIPERADHVRSRARRGSRGGRPPVFDREVYKHRNVVERCFSRLKQWRGIVTRYDKTAQS